MVVYEVSGELQTNGMLRLVTDNINIQVKCSESQTSNKNSNKESLNEIPHEKLITWC